jgi:phospholipid-binding lipoprotein MlaA
MFARILWLLLVLAPCVAPVQASEDDPLEWFNRPVFEFNNTVDRWFLRPVASAYHKVMPDPMERGVSNFFANLYDATSAVNGLLQWEVEGALQSTGRFAVNSTLGLLGFFDVATPIGIRPYRTDFGHTLAVWGVPDGPYVMVPVFGPRTFRSGTGTIVDTWWSVPTYIDNVRLRNSIWGLELVHGRAQLLSSDQLLSGDQYIFVRDAYLQQRRALTGESSGEDEFSNFEDDWGEEF